TRRRRVLAHPVEVLAGVRRVDDDEELVVTALVEDAVVDDAAARPAQQRVGRLAGRRGGHGVRGQPIDELAGARPADVRLTHVRDVEQADRLAHRLVLLDRARGVRDRHVPAAEVDHARAELLVDVVQRGPLALHRPRPYHFYSRSPWLVAA